MIKDVQIDEHSINTGKLTSFYLIKYLYVLNAYNDKIMLLSAGVEFNFFIQMFPSSSKANTRNAFKASIT